MSTTPLSLLPNNHPKDVFNTETAALIGGNYTYLRVDSCGHNVLGCSDPSQFISAIIDNIESAYE